MRDPITITLADYRPHPQNPNTHPDAQLTELGRSLAQFEQVKNVVVWRGYYLAGHGLVAAAQRQGRAALAAVDVSDWDEATALAFMVADNRLAEMGVMDYARLGEVLDAIPNAIDLVPGVDAAYIEQVASEILSAAQGAATEGDTEAEPTQAEAEKYQEIWQVKPGDVWQLGRHKIACVDSTDEATVKALIGGAKVGVVWADPPYGIEAVKNSGTLGTASPFGKKESHNNTGKVITVGNYAKVIGDTTTATACKAFECCADFNALQIGWGANNYTKILPPSEAWIVWDKENSGGYADCELAWTNHPGAVRLFRHMWNGMIKASEHGQRRVHPTQKPVALAEWCFTKYGKPGDVIFDPFLGSGISIIAAENLDDGRAVIGCELAPEYIATVLERWATHTGKTPELIGKG